MAPVCVHSGLSLTTAPCRPIRRVPPPRAPGPLRLENLRRRVRWMRDCELVLGLIFRTRDGRSVAAGPPQSGRPARAAGCSTAGPAQSDGAPGSRMRPLPSSSPRAAVAGSQTTHCSPSGRRAVHTAPGQSGGLSAWIRIDRAVLYGPRARSRARPGHGGNAGRPRRPPRLTARRAGLALSRRPLARARRRGTTRRRRETKPEKLPPQDQRHHACLASLHDHCAWHKATAPGGLYFFYSSCKDRIHWSTV